jgi:two-component system chemotaxis response regulator CheY
MRNALVVDDSKAIRSILGRKLATLGFNVNQASNGAAALQVLEDSPDISLVLVDWNMPHMNGLEFIKAARADPRFAHIVIVMVTTETEQERMEAALAAGANEYIMKPFTDEVITEKLMMLGIQEQSA